MSSRDKPAAMWLPGRQGTVRSDGAESESFADVAVLEVFLLAWEGLVGLHVQRLEEEIKDKKHFN